MRLQHGQDEICDLGANLSGHSQMRLPWWRCETEWTTEGKYASLTHWANNCSEAVAHAMAFFMARYASAAMTSA
jgi:hypothetical protein